MSLLNMMRPLLMSKNSSLVTAASNVFVTYTTTNRTARYDLAMNAPYELCRQMTT